MTNRREILKVGLAVSALPLAGSVALAAGARVPPAVALYKVLYDTRFTASAEFGSRAAAHGLAVHAMNGDVTRFWYDALYYRWRQGPAAIAGLTARGALFCLEQLAWDQRLRVVFRAEHSLAATGCVAHRLEGPAALLPTAVAALSDGHWAVAMADVVAGCPSGRLERAAAQALTPAAAFVAAEPLVSWVIAPVDRA
jgi:hypothetical protein